GGIDLRKNVESLICAFAALPPVFRLQYQLAIVCSVQDADRTRLRNLMKQAGLRDDEVILTGFVPDEALPVLYHACELFV
ncbi:glycosyltransferase, partial [Acinetobacter baumannii]